MTLTRDKGFVLLGILLALFLAALDQTIVATALPKIVEDLHGLNRYSWVATAYLTASTTFVPIYGKLADMYSRKKIELLAIFVFLTGSFLCGLAGEFGNLPVLGDGMNQLIIFRSIQGLGSAGLFSMAFIIIADLFPPAERGKYQGFIGAVFGLSSILGPWIGGLLTDYGGEIIPGVAGWRWVFYVNVPFAILALWVILQKLPPLIPAKSDKKINYGSALLLIAGIAPLVIALQMNKLEHPWTDPLTLGMVIGSLIFLILFVFISVKAKNPILDLGLFKNRIFSTSVLALFFTGASFFCIIIFMPLYMINVVEISATKAGITLIPLSLGVVFGSIVTGQLVSRFGHYKLWMLTGAVTLFVGVLLLSTMGISISYWRVIFYMSICGLGIGPSMPLYTLAIQNAVAPEEIGQATSASQFFRQIGASLGTALMGTVLAFTLTLAFKKDLANLPEGISMKSLGTSPTKILSSGGADLKKRIFKEAEQEFIKVVDGNIQGQKLPLVPENLRERQTTPVSTPSERKKIRQAILSHTHKIYSELNKDIRLSFSSAITRIYFYTLFIVGLAFVSTLFIPEIPLRKSNRAG